MPDVYKRQALIAGIYLDGGLEAAQRFVLPFVEEDLTHEAAPFVDYKTRLQEIIQKLSLIHIFHLADDIILTAADGLPYGIVEGLGIAAAMRLNDRLLGAQQQGPAVFGGIKLLLKGAQILLHHGGRQLIGKGLSLIHISGAALGGERCL